MKITDKMVNEALKFKYGNDQFVAMKIILEVL
jgi:hypothetical protein